MTIIDPSGTGSVNEDYEDDYSITEPVAKGSQKGPDGDDNHNDGTISAHTNDAQPSEDNQGAILKFI